MWSDVKNLQQIQFLSLITLFFWIVIKPTEISFKKEGELTLYKSTSDSIITKLDIEIADTDYDVETGLMYRTSMKDQQGMLFVFPTMRQRSFYMKNTLIPLDIIYLDNNFRP